MAELYWKLQLHPEITMGLWRNKSLKRQKDSLDNQLPVLVIE